MANQSAPKPKYRKLLDQLSEDILSGRYKPGQKLPSEAALVQRHGVSRITVGRALRDLRLGGLIDRVAGSGSYVRGRHAASEAHLLFGLIIPDLGDTEIFEPICHGMASSSEAGGHALLWAGSGASNLPKEDEALALSRQCIERKVSGAFFAPLELSERAAAVNRRVLNELRSAKIPVVLLDRRPADGGEAGMRCDLAGIDNHRAGYLATEHLLKLGAARIGFVSRRIQASTVRSRIAGYREALGEYGKDIRGDMVPITDAGALNLEGSASECDAFVCANDRHAGHLMRELLSRGLRVPRDVRIVGIDDVSYASLLPVPLTTIHQPCREIGETAMRVMLERLDRPMMPARSVLLDCWVVVRDSCGASK